MPRPAPHVVSEEPRAAWTTPRQPLHDAKTVAPTIDPSLAAARVYSYKKADPGAESRFLPQLASDAAPSGWIVLSLGTMLSPDWMASS